MSKKILLSLCTCALVLTLTGCGKQVATLSDGSGAVTSFNTEEIENISANELYTKLKDQYGISALINMIDTKLLNKDYETTDEMKKNADSQIKSWISMFGDESSLLQQTKSAFGVDTIEGLKEYLYTESKREQNTKDYVSNEVKDSEIKNYYDKKVFGDMELKHILIKPDVESDATDEEKAEAEEKALKKAVELVEKLKNGDNFEDLAKENSNDDATKENGGDLGTITWTESMDENFIDAAKKLEKEKYTTTPVKSSFGYHIIYKVNEEEKKSLDDVKDTIRKNIADEKISEDTTGLLTTKAIIALREKYGVKIDDEELKKSYDVVIQNQLNPQTKS